MNLQRLRQMDLGEIAGRSRMKASKWWDRVGDTVGRRAPDLDAQESHRRLEAFRESAPSVFFEGASDPRTPALLAQRAPDSMRLVIARAEEALTGRFDLLGYRRLSFGRPVDWHLDPVSGRRAPLVHWSRLDPLDTASVGDSKVVWELNRHQWLVSLAEAYRMTRDERYAEGFSAYLEQWLASNPAGRGINWASSLELAFRLVAWCWALVLFRRSASLRPEMFVRMECSIEEQARQVEKYLSYYFSPNTHLTGEALGLLYVGTLFPGLSRAREWRERGARILADEIPRQVMSDGVYFEQSTCYQRYTAEIALHYLILCARTGVPVPSALRERVQAMLDFLLAVGSPRGEAPPIGDADGGWLLPFVPRGAGDLRGVFGVAAALFGRPDYAWAADGDVPEALWLLGPPGLAAFDAVRPAPPEGSPSRLFAEGGYAVMRNGWKAQDHQLIFDVGSLGCPISGGHGHADLLSVQCSVFGEGAIVDGGVGTYADEEWRSFFRSTAAHSTVMVDGLSQAVPSGPFTWQQRPCARLRRWVSTEAFDFADADHGAYGRLSDPVRHRRRVLFIKPRYWVIVDDLEGRAPHRFELRFQFGPRDVRLERDSWARAAAGGGALLLRPFSVVPLEARLRSGSNEPREGWISPDYGRHVPAPVVAYSATAPLPVRVVTLLLPSADPAARPPAVKPLRHGDGVLVGLEFESTGETVAIEGIDGLPAHLPPADLGS